MTSTTLIGDDSVVSFHYTLRDDAGSIGDYLVLVRGNGFSLLCRYFEGGDPLAPLECG